MENVTNSFLKTLGMLSKASRGKNSVPRPNKNDYKIKAVGFEEGSYYILFENKKQLTLTKVPESENAISYGIVDFTNIMKNMEPSVIFNIDNIEKCEVVFPWPFNSEDDTIPFKRLVLEFYKDEHRILFIDKLIYRFHLTSGEIYDLNKFHIIKKG